MEKLIWVDEPEKKASIAASILIRLPDWFGLPESTRHYIEESRSLPFLACLSE